MGRKVPSLYLCGAMAHSGQPEEHAGWLLHTEQGPGGPGPCG